MKEMTKRCAGLHTKLAKEIVATDTRKTIKGTFFSTIIKMSDEELSPEEALLKRQRKERKDLQVGI